VFERFTERARQVVVLAQDEARLLGHNYIGTEHLLLGLLREDEGLAAHVLDTFDITVEAVRAQVARRVGQGAKAPTGRPIPLAPAAKEALELSLRETLSLGHDHIDTQHILLGLVREHGVAARILLDLDAEPAKILTETMRMLSGPSRRQHAPSGSTGFFIPAEGEATPGEEYDGPLESPRLVVACPACATPIETLSTDQPTARLHVSMQGNHACPGCGRRWAITIAAEWTDPSPPNNPDDDLPSQFTAWHHPEPAHFSMGCFRCDYVLERVALDTAATNPTLRLEANTDRTCPVCSKTWRIAYTVSWEERPGGSSAPSG
jgi:hypothetical protein